ncbi:hypothetical protein DICVIV_06831 [Dictyocaulus viviparus]|uniref:Integrator complex subunit 1 R4 domain-containing protein n=1 Tax=Dictyocaulus viviparus TaxID=29172 RepID=A0A0D8XXI7_DICVI|nr:hypothetical protein DICVIV_06831 [Dictyocaulus viviparus]
MNSSSESIRASGFGYALDIIGQKPQTRNQLKEIYINKIQSTDLDVARQAITFLPDFVSLCIVNADELISAATHRITSRNVLNDVSDYVVHAMKIFGHLLDEDPQNSTDLKKEIKRRSREDGEII